MPRGVTSVTSPRRLRALERQRRALELRRSGRTLEDIARTLGYRQRAGAYKAIASALQRTLREPAEALRNLEMERLDRLQVALWPRAVQGDVKAVDAILRIMERRARLLGLDMPQRREVASPGGEPFTFALKIHDTDAEDAELSDV